MSQCQKYIYIGGFLMGIKKPSQSQFTIRGVAQQIKKNTINLEHRIQRRGAWTLLQQQLFIASIIENIKIPGIVVVEENGIIEWINGNLGSNVTMLYPASILKGDNSKADFIGIAFAGKNQNQNTGSKVIHIGKNTSSTIVSKSITKDGGITSYRGLLSIGKKAENAKSSINCDALMFDKESQSNTFPFMDIQNNSATVGHEATVGKIGEDQLFYLTSRGLSEQEAMTMIVMGFFRPFTKQLPMEYAVEMNRLIEMEMEGSVG